MAQVLCCSMCDKEFTDGTEYREHWEKEHLEKILKIKDHESL